MWSDPVKFFLNESSSSGQSRPSFHLPAISSLLSLHFNAGSGVWICPPASSLYSSAQTSELPLNGLNYSAVSDGRMVPTPERWQDGEADCCWQTSDCCCWTGNSHFGQSCGAALFTATSTLSLFLEERQAVWVCGGFRGAEKQYTDKLACLPKN